VMTGVVSISSFAVDRHSEVLTKLLQSSS